MVLNRFTVSAHTALTKLSGLLILIALCHLDTFGQNRKYLVLLRDKANSPYSVNQPDKFLSQRSIARRQRQNITILERDLPVNPAYLTQLQQAGAKIWFSSRWLNAVLVEANDATIANVQQLPIVKGLEFGRSLANARIGATDSVLSSANEMNALNKFGDVQPLNYGSSLAQITQIGVDKMHQQGYHGEGMLIGVLDAGFQNADRVSFLKPVFDEKRILATYDFVKKETSVYEDDSHGLSCLSAIAATADNQLYGTAYKASFILLRTEDAASERQIEEANWLFGAEYADSAGVDVISSSLGYTQFDDASTSYTYQNMDGNTALSSRAAEIATQTGMVVVVAAGNEGNSSWHYLSAPSDAASVLAIGAVGTTGQRASFSSFGPSADGRIKPDLDAQGLGTTVGYPTGAIGSGNGTSFATPLIAGLVAGFWQAHPRLTAAQVTDALRRSGSQYGTPNDQLGYGIPNFERASSLSDTYNELMVFPNPFSDEQSLGVQWGEIQENTPLDATLTNMAGRIVWQNRYVSPGLAAFRLPNLNLSAGVYVMTLVAGDKKRTLKLVKQ
ncbi:MULTISPECIES: S8 family serine peptidase [unclassified Spirosoma]|uniref:S8 family serine peptidase n=1 Tax=unclassified Spirosoma TaxID=2621999 RepID=UPI00095DB3FE|nr:MULTISPECIES: S8 family serine peptidase [unclassified Spirosoma]MBN8826194.1 S8 family serine peptidase [Spirosoma sp.]OJW76910.1 MAG: peptidase S8 [Spirosoma sp. 48-14]